MSYGQAEISGPSNEVRAQWAGQALKKLCRQTGLDPETETREAVKDLICNLGHYSDLHQLDFLNLLSSAIASWDAEKREQAAGQPNALYPMRGVTLTLNTLEA
jgi:hypothetical protein